MTADPLRVATLAAFMLCGGLLPCVAAAPAAEQDTAHGVAPVKPATEAASVTPVSPAPPSPVAVATPPANEGQRYCDNIATVAAEARFAWQTKKLTDLQGQVTQRIAELEKKQSELQASLARRDDVMKRAQATLIAIYAKMDVDAAAQQLSLLDDELAAAILTQLTPKQSSAILNGIKPARASQLVGAMTSLPSIDTKAADGKKS
ncbi:MotE family protein [Lichenifustis flavocetrariae]|uniref:MotE family protein n=1 Tax=Lichenifustis flavocetrariae TaxID=2949735 RepID=A0AA42CMB5_9HYPH|nr:MotE family protein [Lichenifustis flavocetrariae]MCW6511386.1 MotE family protein [Lichenifustis flavocetrariae]